MLRGAGSAETGPHRGAKGCPGRRECVPQAPPPGKREQGRSVLVPLQPPLSCAQRPVGWVSSRPLQCPGGITLTEVGPNGHSALQAGPRG